MFLDSRSGFESLEEKDRDLYEASFDIIYRGLFEGIPLPIDNPELNPAIEAAYQDANRLFRIREVMIKKS